MAVEDIVITFDVGLVLATLIAPCLMWLVQRCVLGGSRTSGVGVSSEVQQEGQECTTHT